MSRSTEVAAATTRIIGVAISRTTPAACVCPTCRIFEKEAAADSCPRCTLIRANRERSAESRRRHFDAVELELTALRLDAIDPDWPNKFLSTMEAARHYRERLVAMDSVR